MTTLIESLKMAVTSIGAHKLRSFLTLVGIIAGVAAIVSVMTGVSVIQSQMESELSVLGGRVFQLQKWPPGGFGNRSNRNWREIQRWPPLTVEHADLIREKVDAVDLVGAELWQYNAVASYRGEKTEAVNMICGGTPEYPENNTHYVDFGRNISHEDVRVARRVAVIGPNIARTLFPFSDPIGREIRVDGLPYTVQGVFAERTSAMGGNFDNYILMPITAFQKVYGSRDGWGNPRTVNITVRAVSPDLLEDAIAEATAVLRAARGLSPRDEDNFFHFTSDSQIRAFNTASAGLKRGAFVLGIVALIVAGIGIMNIMLVSVTERTREIGIRKALGAKRREILLQFLLEAIVLCNIGGVLGVAVGFGLGNLVSVFTDFGVNVPLDWVVRGLAFCTAVGLSFGLWPAVRASRLAPIEALRFE
jgi:putative ABC transport system permease protein